MRVRPPSQLYVYHAGRAHAPAGEIRGAGTRRQLLHHAVVVVTVVRPQVRDIPDRCSEPTWCGAAQVPTHTATKEPACSQNAHRFAWLGWPIPASVAWAEIRIVAYQAQLGLPTAAAESSDDERKAPDRKAGGSIPGNLEAHAGQWSAWLSSDDAGAAALIPAEARVVDNLISRCGGQEKHEAPGR